MKFLNYNYIFLMLMIILVSLFYPKRENYENTQLSDWQNLQTNVDTLFQNGYNDLITYPIFDSTTITKITSHQI